MPSAADNADTRRAVQRVFRGHPVPRTRVQRTTLKPDERSNRSPEDLQREQRNGPSFGIIINWLKASPIRPSWREMSPQNLEVNRYWRLWDSLSIHDGVLTYRWETANRDGVSLRVLPRCIRWDAWRQLHEDPCGGHLGISKTLEKLRERFFWAGQSLDVKKWCEACTICSAKKGPPRQPCRGTIDGTWFPTRDLVRDRTDMRSAGGHPNGGAGRCRRTTWGPCDAADPEERVYTDTVSRCDQMRLNPDVRRGTRRRQPPLRYGGGS